jgi:hypothetical protein
MERWLSLAQISPTHFSLPAVDAHVKTGVYEYFPEHDSGFQSSRTPEILNSNEFRRNKGFWNQRSAPKTAQVTASKDVVGLIYTRLDTRIFTTIQVQSQ